MWHVNPPIATYTSDNLKLVYSVVVKSEKGEMPLPEHISISQISNLEGEKLESALAIAMDELKNILDQNTLSRFPQYRTCHWCGDKFALKNDRAVYCCAQHKQKARDLRVTAQKAMAILPTDVDTNAIIIPFEFSMPTVTVRAPYANTTMYLKHRDDEGEEVFCFSVGEKLDDGDDLEKQVRENPFNEIMKYDGMVAVYSKTNTISPFRYLELYRVILEML